MKNTADSLTVPGSRTDPSALADPGRPKEFVSRVSSKSLLGPSGELAIEHSGRLYKLRITQNGKLILTA